MHDVLFRVRPSSPERFGTEVSVPARATDIVRFPRGPKRRGREGGAKREGPRERGVAGGKAVAGGDRCRRGTSQEELRAGAIEGAARAEWPRQRRAAARAGEARDREAGFAGRKPLVAEKIAKTLNTNP